MDGDPNPCYSLAEVINVFTCFATILQYDPQTANYVATMPHP